MKLFKAFEELDQVELDKLESIQLTKNTSDNDVLSIIGLAAPVLIRVLEIWKKIPGKKQATRNIKLDKIIAALRIAGLISIAKFS